MFSYVELGGREHATQELHLNMIWLSEVAGLRESIVERTMIATSLVLPGYE